MLPGRFGLLLPGWFGLLLPGWFGALLFASFFIARCVEEFQAFLVFFKGRHCVSCMCVLTYSFLMPSSTAKGTPNVKQPS